MNTKSFLTFAFTIFMLIVVGWYISSHWDEIGSVQLTNPVCLITLAVLLFVRMGLRGLFHWQVLRSLGVPIPMVESLALNYTGTMMNQLLPMPFGPGYRAAYLKRKFRFPFSLFASTLAALFIYWLLFSSALGLLASGWFYFTSGVYDWGIVAILACAVTGCLITFILPKTLSLSEDSNHWLMVRLQRIVTGWNTIVGSRKLVIGASVVVVVSTAVSAVAMNAAFQTVGVSIGLPGALLLMASQRIGSLIKLTPGAIGYQEMVGVYFASLLVPTSAEAAVVFGLIRIVSCVLGVVVGLPSVWALNSSAFNKSNELEIASQSDNEEAAQ